MNDQNSEIVTIQILSIEHCDDIIDTTFENDSSLTLQLCSKLSIFEQKYPVYNTEILPSREFRSDIQVLRCLAVVLVTLFHLDISFFSGGFIGVDIFFVISGYLVVGSIFRSCLNNKFDYILFLSSRIKRLFPASAICLIFIILLFVIFPQIQQISGNQGWYDIFWASLHGANVKFYLNENQYFRSDNTVSFVLHYWSLALEEQFYLIFPLIFICFYKILNYLTQYLSFGDKYNRSFITLFIVCIGLCSLIVSLLPQISTSQKFFLLHTRVWEFLAGSLISLYQQDISTIIKEKIPTYQCTQEYSDLTNLFVALRWLLIFTLILCGIFVSPQSYPNEITLMIVIITCAIIAFDYPIENIVLESIGNWSYSIYLYHFPIIQLFRVMYNSWLPNTHYFITYEFQIKIVAILVLTMLFALISFYTIEQQILRINLAPMIWYIIIISISCIVAGIAASLFTFPTLILSTQVHSNVSYYNQDNFMNNLKNMSLDQIALLKYNTNIAKHTGYLGHNINTYISKKLEFTSLNLNNESNKCLLLYGDSNGMHWFPAIEKLSYKLNISTIFFADSYDRYNNGQLFDEREGDEFIIYSKNNIKFQQCTSVLSIFARMSKITSHNNVDKKALSLRLHKLTNFFGQKGCSIIINSIPRMPGEYDPNHCLSIEIYNEMKFNNIELPIISNNTNKLDILNVNFITKCSLNKNISVFDYNEIANNSIILSMNKYLCTPESGVCPANYYDVPIYMDQSHLSEAIVWMLSPTFVDEIINMPCVKSSFVPN